MKNILGHLAYLLEGSKRIWNVPTYWIKVEANGETFEGEYIYGMVTNAKSVGGFKTCRDRMYAWMTDSSR